MQLHVLAELVGAPSESLFRSHSAALVALCLSRYGCSCASQVIWDVSVFGRQAARDDLSSKTCCTSGVVGARCFTEPLEDWLHRVRRQSPCSRVRPYLQPDPTSTETSDILRKDVAIIFAEQSRIVTCVLMESSSHGWHVSNALILGPPRGRKEGRREGGRE